MEQTLPDKRMQRLATGMLITMLVILVLANLFLSAHPAVGYLRAFAEAGVVGALADWFAVTALFRQPLACRFRIPQSSPATRNVSANRWDASSSKTLLLPRWFRPNSQVWICPASWPNGYRSRSTPQVFADRVISLHSATAGLRRRPPSAALRFRQRIETGARY